MLLGGPVYSRGANPCFRKLLRLAPRSLSSRCGLAALSSLGAGAAPRTPRAVPGSARHLGRPFPVSVGTACSRYRKVARGAGVPVVISAPSLSAEPHRKGRVRNVLQVPSGKAANVALPPPPLPSPRGWPPCFLNTKWRHVAWIPRGEIGVSTKALECAQPSPPAPVRRWGTSCLASLLTTWIKPFTGWSRP